MKDDARVRYTKMVIRESFLGLLKAKGIQEITVKEICGLAGVNRATFYKHYKSVYDLLDRIENELFEEMKAILAGMKQDIFALTTQAFDLIAKNIDVCRILFSENGDRRFLSGIMSLSREKTISLWKAEYPNATKHQLDYLFAFVLSGAVAVIEHWVRIGMKETPFELGEIADKVCKNWLKKTKAS